MPAGRTSASVDHAAYFEVYQQLLGSKKLVRAADRKSGAADADVRIIPALIGEFWEELDLAQDAFLCMDSSPFYPAFDGQQALPQTIFVSTRGARSSPEIERELFSIYFSNALQTVGSAVYIFFHPVLTGLRRTSSLIPGHSSIVRPTPARQMATSPEFRDAYDWIMSRYQGRSYEDGRSAALELELSRADAGEHSVSIYNQSVRSLGLPDTGNYADFVAQHFTARPGRPALETSDAFQAMNAAFHIRLHERMAKLLPEASESTSFLKMLPVNLVPPGEADEAGGVPRAYRGGCWIYLSVCGPVNAILQRKINAALQKMMRELWFTLSTEYNKRAADAIARLEKLSTRGSMLHQLPSDFGAMATIIAKLKRKAASASEPLRSELLEELSTLDVFMVQGMFLSAVSRKGRGLSELPKDLAKALSSGLSDATVRPIFDRLVVSAAMYRVGMEASDRWIQLGWTDEEMPGKVVLEEAASRIDLRVAENALKPGVGFYPLFLVSMRNAYQHALIWAVLNPGSRGLIEVSVQPGEAEDVVIITNTGLIPQGRARTAAAQEGMVDDVRVFRGLTGNWSVKETGAGRYVVYLPDAGEWATSIVFSKQPSLRNAGSRS